MADARKDDNVFHIEVGMLQRQWLRKCVELQKQALHRARGKEILGSEMYAIRSRELAELDAILVKL